MWTKLVHMETINFDEPVNIHEAKTHFSKLVAAVERGETVIISRYGKPVAKMRPYVPEDGKAPLPFGISRDKFSVPDDIDAPLPDDMLNALYGVQETE